MLRMFDSHAHYFDPCFERKGQGVDALLTTLFNEEVEYIVNVGTDVESSRLCVAQAAKYPGMYCAVGIHPSDGQRCDDPEAELAALDALLGTPDTRKRDKIVALGEIGLDYHYDGTNKEKQAMIFEAQLQLAEKHHVPVIIHDREAHGDCFDAILRHPDVTGVFHCYSGSAEMAKDLVRRGWYISFSGVATYKNAAKVWEAIAVVPDDRLLIETDAPYLAPVPYRGKMNHSGYLYYTADAVGGARFMGVDDVVSITKENAKRLFGIS